MKLTILLCSLLFAAIAARDVYAEGATTVDSPGAAAVVPAAKLGVNEASAANHRRMMTGEEACENHGFNWRECRDVGCCQWAECPSTSPVGGGQCHSAARVQNGRCTYEPELNFDVHVEDGPHCWADLKETHKDGCQGGLWGSYSGFWGRVFLTPRCKPCEGDCDNDDDCLRKMGSGTLFSPFSGIRGKCFQRNGYTPVPGCKGTGKKDWDYCIWEEP